ncbi:hypothetical protein BKA63DRAFT_153728 [Paraphoma chrysanthemicola]|nr:hypothetical protein BKA63DRAFT_153728 [Paraphoma chrysanthemicola]
MTRATTKFELPKMRLSSHNIQFFHLCLLKLFCNLGSLVYSLPVTRLAEARVDQNFAPSHSSARVATSLCVALLILLLDLEKIVLHG